MAKFIIKFKKEECIGCGACTVQCPENWELVEEAGMFKAKPKQAVLTEIGKNKDAKDICPVSAIDIVEQ